MFSYKIGQESVIECDEGFSVQVIGRAGLLYREGEPTERLWYSIVGLGAAVEMMNDRYAADLMAEISEAVALGREWLRKANGPW